MESYRHPGNHTPSFDREQLRYITYNTTPEQRMNWLQEAMELVQETEKARKKATQQKKESR